MMRVVFACAAIAWLAIEAKEPIDYLEPCKRNDPNLNDCIKDRANVIIPLLAEGVEEYDLPPLDPLHTPIMEIEMYSEHISANVTYTDLVQIGFTQGQLVDAKVDLEAGDWIVTISLPWYNANGNYKASGKVLADDFEGTGHFNTSFYGTVTDFIIKTELQKRGGADHLKVKAFRVAYTIENMKTEYHRDNYPPEADAHMNKILNDNAQEILRDTKPSFEKFYSDLFGKLLQNFFDHVPYDKMLPVD